MRSVESVLRQSGSEYRRRSRVGGWLLPGDHAHVGWEGNSWGVLEQLLGSGKSLAGGQGGVGRGVSRLGRLLASIPRIPFGS